MNYKKQILSLRGETFPKTFATQKEINKLPRKKNPNDPKGADIPDIEKLECETVGNVILNCLATHKCENRKEGFYINMIAEHVIGGNEKAELKAKLKDFLIEILEDSIMRIEKVKDKSGNETKEEKGLYAGWIIAQVLREMGVEEGD